MQALSVTPGFWLVKVNIAALESLSVMVTVPAENVFPVLSVVPDSAAHVPGPATDHSTVSRTTLSASRATVAGRSRLRDRRSSAAGATTSPVADRWSACSVDSAYVAMGLS